MDVNEHERPYKIIGKHKLMRKEKKKSVFIDALHCTVAVSSSTMSTTRTLP
jgi:hypothetical protein